MERWTQPVAVITTLQPILLLWVLAIAFFVTMTLVALFSRNRTWKEILMMFVFGYLGVVLVTLFSSEYVVGIDVMQFEFVTYRLPVE